MILQKSLLFALLLATAWALPQEFEYDDDYDYGEEEEEGDFYDSLPEFLVQPQHLKAKEGSTVVISCESSETPYVLIIKKAGSINQKEALIFVDNVKVRRDKRYKRIGDNLEISNLKRSDAGTYICSLESDPQVQISHVLEVEFSPKITAVTKEKRVHKGDSVSLECVAGGNPTPVIKWSKQDGRLPSGAKEEEVSSSSSTESTGLSITLADIDRHVEGDYVCTAENGIGEPASDVISVFVEYPPEIITEKDMVRTTHGDTVELVCIVHGRPTPNVEWTKDGNRLALDSHIEEQRNGAHRNSIKITQISEADFGEYICTAENKFGVVEANITLSGVPKPPHFTSSPNGGEEKSYTLTWYTESYYPVTEYRLKYRKARANDSTDEPGEWTDLTHKFNGNLETSGLVHNMKHRLDDLEGATDYHAVVQIRNQYVWGDSAEFSFSTRKEMAQPTKISGVSRASVSTALLVLLPSFLLRSHC